MYKLHGENKKSSINCIYMLGIFTTVCSIDLIYCMVFKNRQWPTIKSNVFKTGSTVHELRMYLNISMENLVTVTKFCCQKQLIMLCKS